MHSRLIRWLLSSLLLCIVYDAFAQPSAVLQQAFMDLSSDAVVMDLSAHPDDEDGSTLAYYRMHQGAKTYSVLFTRGEGGQNEKGSELYEELGVLRSQETREAGAILGAEVQFLNFLDFGYSKTASEAFSKWGGQREALRRLVYALRRYKPDVIFTNHNTIDGHGHHQAVAITAIAAFDAAADPTIFPEQLRLPGVTLWQPKKLFFRASGRAEAMADVSNAIADVDPARGIAYTGIALEALRKHRTQGMDRANLGGFTRRKSLYRLVRTSSLFENDSTNFLGGMDLYRDPTLSPLKPLRSHLNHWHAGMPQDSLLREASAALHSIDSVHTAVRSPLGRRVLDHWKKVIERIVAASCGLSVRLVMEDSVLVANQDVPCSLNVQCTTCSLGLLDVHFELPEGWRVTELPGAARASGSGGIHRRFLLRVGPKPEVTLPRARAQYRPVESFQEVAAELSITLDGYQVAARAEAAFEVAPDQELLVIPERRFIPAGQERDNLTFRYHVINHLPHDVRGTVRLAAPAGWRSEAATFTIGGEEDTARGLLRVRPPSRLAGSDHRLLFRTEESQATASVGVLDVRLAPDLKLGVVSSYDTTIEATAHELGLSHTLLDDSTLVHGNLSGYSTILIDIRAYLVRDGLRTSNLRLLDYVKNGGNLIVMYQREQEWKPEYAPYPFEITRSRVTVEEAPVVMLERAHPLFNFPNRIAPADWDGWKQERGVYFPGKVPPEYTRLVATADPDEEPLTTGYLVARYGRGTYIYTSLVWYRQLKEDNPGAVRCFANMVSYPAYRGKGEYP